MKLTGTLLATAIASFFMFTRCDIVEDPYEHIDEDIEIGTDIHNDTFYSDTTLPVSRRVMIEDFTGMKCNNCPRATDIGKELLKTYPEEIVFAALHNSSRFSKPDEEFPLDLETETGEQLRVRYQINGFPKGMINRTDYESTGTVEISDQNWTNTVTQMIKDPEYIAARFNMKITAIYNSENRVLRVRPDIECLKNIAEDVLIHAYVLEDGIIGPQIDSRVDRDVYPQQIIPDYKFERVVRAGFPNGESGKLLFSQPKVGDRFTVTNPDEDELRVSVSEEWNDKELSLIVYLTLSESKEIIHSEYIGLK